MGVARGRGLRPGSIVRSVGRLMLLVGLGFGAGLVIGVLSEEPSLLMGHLRGESESVRLSGGEEPGPAGGLATTEGGERAGGRDEPPTSRSNDAVGAGEVASGADSGSPGDPTERQQRRLALLEGRGPGSSEEAPAPEVAAAARDQPVSQPAAVQAGSAAAPGVGHWAIQVGAFSDPKWASDLVTSLRSKGYPVELIPATEASKRWRVRVQPVEGKTRAQDLAERLKREQRLPTWLIPLEADAGS